MKYFMILILLIQSTLGNTALAREYWITTSGVSSREKLEEATRTFLSAYPKQNSVSLQEALLQNPIPPLKLKKILSEQTIAKDLALEGNFKEAYEVFINILKLLDDVPNVAGIENIRLSVYLQLAQLDENYKKLRISPYWSQARSWAPQTKLDQDVYSPTVVARFQKGVTSLPIKTVFIKSPEFARIFIDGREVPYKELLLLRLHGGFHQLATIAPGGLWQIKNFEVEETSEQQEITITNKPAVTGTCEQPQFNGETLDSDIRLVGFFSESCFKIYDGQWKNPDGAPVDPRALGVVSESPSPFNSLEAPQSQSWFSKLTHSPWFWIGAAVATTATILVVKNSQEKQVEVVPTHTEQ